MNFIDIKDKVLQNEEKIAEHDASLAESTQQASNISKLFKNYSITTDDKNLRICAVTDIHIENNSDADIGYGNADVRTQALIDSINAEHDKKTIDFLLITGDIALGIPEDILRHFFEYFVPQLKMPVVAIPGNHDNVQNDVWKDITGYNRQFSFETNNMYFICLDTFPNNLNKTSISHWSASFSSAIDKCYIGCASTDVDALLVVSAGATTGQINQADVTPMASDWLGINDIGNYVKYVNVEDADMYEDPSIDYVKSEVLKAGNKSIILVSHKIMAQGDKEYVMAYLNGLPNYLGCIEGHYHYYNFSINENNKFTLNLGHWWYPNSGWGSAEINNYRGFSIIEMEDRVLKETRIIPMQNQGTTYVANYTTLSKNLLGGCPLIKNNFTTRNLTELTALNDTDYFMFENPDGAKKVSKNNLFSSSSLLTTNKNVFGAINEIIANAFNIAFVDLPTTDSIENFATHVIPRGFLIFKINSYGNQVVTGMPSNANYYGFIFGFGGNNTKIIAFPYGSDAIYIKNNNSGTWSDWTQK